MTLTLGSQPKQRHGKMHDKSAIWESHSHCQECGKVREWAQTFPSGFSLRELESQWTLEFSKNNLKRSKFIRLKKSLYD